MKFFRFCFVGIREAYETETDKFSWLPARPMSSETIYAKATRNVTTPRPEPRRTSQMRLKSYAGGISGRRRRSLPTGQRSAKRTGRKRGDGARFGGQIGRQARFQLRFIARAIRSAPRQPMQCCTSEQISFAQPGK